ncbi:MAG: HD-GYP domain-containing protein [Gammaproteobacteria bacterium]
MAISQEHHSRIIHAHKPHLVGLDPDRVQAGMYVDHMERMSGFSPFPVQGFYVTGRHQLDEIQRSCKLVFIDPAKSFLKETDRPNSAAEKIAAAPRPDNFAEEFRHARFILQALTSEVKEMVHHLRIGKLPDVPALLKTLTPIIASVESNPDALMLLIRTETTIPFIYRRAIGTGVLAAAFGRHLGLDTTALKDLALGGLLLDIGKIEVPVPILAKADNLSTEERHFAEKHVDWSTAMLRLMSNIPHRVADMVASHHERMDGSGYPDHREGTDIPLYARVAAIVDTFDAVTMDRHYAAAMTSHTALRYLSGQRKLKFDAALFDEFVHALGSYPIGTWVQLQSGSIGIVCTQNKRWPITPKVLIVANAEHRAIPMPRIIEPTRVNPIMGILHASLPEFDSDRLQQALDQVCGQAPSSPGRA